MGSAWINGDQWITLSIPGRSGNRTCQNRYLRLLPVDYLGRRYELYIPDGPSAVGMAVWAGCKPFSVGLRTRFYPELLGRWRQNSSAFVRPPVTSQISTEKSKKTPKTYELWPRTALCSSVTSTSFFAQEGCEAGTTFRTTISIQSWWNWPEKPEVVKK